VEADVAQTQGCSALVLIVAKGLSHTNQQQMLWHLLLVVSPHSST
jgi:hypothetical protein